MFDMNNLKRNTTKREPSEEVPSGTAPAAPAEPRPASPVKEPATIGASIQFKGDLTGEEDFVIQGKVEGTINLQKNNLTIGKNGRIRANVTANTIIIEGQLQGDMFGNEKVIIRKSGNVLGNIVAPRVTLEDGAKFKGSIEMEPKAGEAFSGSGKKSEPENRGTGTGAGGTPGTSDFKGAQQ